MPHAANLVGVDIYADEEDAGSRPSATEVRLLIGELSRRRLCKAQQCREDMHRDGRDQADVASPVMHPIERSLLTLDPASCPKR